MPKIARSVFCQPVFVNSIHKFEQKKKVIMSPYAKAFEFVVPNGKGNIVTESKETPNQFEVIP
jgi:hypothetical protein